MVWDDKKHIASKIKYYRKKANLSQQELAELIDISSKQLSRIEVGAYIPSLPTFLKIANVLKIDLSDFGLNFKDENKKRETFIKFIYQLNDNELDFGFKTLENIFANLREQKIKL